MATTTQKKATDFTDAAKTTAGKATEFAKDAAEKATDFAKGAASTVAEKAGEAGSYLAEKADDATSAVGGGMESLAGTIRDRGPQKGVLGNASSAVAGTLESGGRYLREHGLSGIADDITDIIRKNPLPAILIGVGVGFLLAKAMRR